MDQTKKSKYMTNTVLQYRTAADVWYILIYFNVGLMSSMRPEGGTPKSEDVSHSLPEDVSHSLPEDVSHSLPVYLPLLASPFPSAQPWMTRTAVTLYVTCRCSHPIGQLSLKYAELNPTVSLRVASGEIRKRVEAGASVSGLIWVRYESPWA